MKIIQHQTHKLWQILPLFGFLLNSCIFKGGDCSPEMKDRFIVLQIMDKAIGKDITETGEAGNAQLYLFSPEGEYAGQFSASSDQIKNHTPILLPAGKLDKYYVTAWTNMGTSQHFHFPSEDSQIEEQAVSLIKGEDEYHQNPDNLFFGYTNLSATEEDSPEKIILVRKNARMRITVRGLDTNIPEDCYYLTIQIPNNGYNFSGKPSKGDATLRETGRFEDNGDFSTQETFNLIHTDEEDTSSVGGVTVCLYEKSPGYSTERLLVSTTQDSNGQSLSLPSGQTVNLLIDLSKETNISVYTQITPWDEIYQWTIW